MIMISKSEAQFPRRVLIAKKPVRVEIYQGLGIAEVVPNQFQEYSKQQRQLARTTRRPFHKITPCFHLP